MYQKEIDIIYSFFSAKLVEKDTFTCLNERHSKLFAGRKLTDVVIYGDEERTQLQLLKVLQVCAHIYVLNYL